MSAPVPQKRAAEEEAADDVEEAGEEGEEAQRNGAARRTARRTTKSKDDKAVLTYREGELLRELSKYLADGAAEGAPLEVRIPADAVTAANRQVRARQLWGTDLYTEDSDLVAVLVHTGFYALPSGAGAAPPPGLTELRATLRPVPPQEAYVSTARHGIRSRAWGNSLAGGAAQAAAAAAQAAPLGGASVPAAPVAGPPAAAVSYRVERCCAVMASAPGAPVELDPGATRGPGACATFVLSAAERSVHTRAASADAQRRQRYCREVTLQYSLCHEPWTKYAVAAVADRGLKRQQWTSARLRREVLYLETHAARFELAWEGLTPPEKGDKGEKDGGDGALDAFRWARCRTPRPLDDARGFGAPLPSQELAVLAKGVAWEAIAWGAAGVTVAGTLYPVVRLQFAPARRPGAK